MGYPYTGGVGATGAEPPPFEVMAKSNPYDPQGTYAPGTTGAIMQQAGLSANAQGYPVDAQGNITLPLVQLSEYDQVQTGPLADRLTAIINATQQAAVTESAGRFFVPDAQGVPVRTDTPAMSIYQSAVAMMNARTQGVLTEGNVQFLEQQFRDMQAGTMQPVYTGGPGGVGGRGMAGGGTAGGGGGTTGGGGGTMPGTGGMTGTPGQRDALARLRVLFSNYGLPETVGDWAWQAILTGKSEAEIVNDLYDPANAGGAAFAARFPAIAARRKAGLAPISPAEYIQYERGYRQLVESAGLPVSFYDTPQDVQSFIQGDVSLAEVADRISRGYTAVKALPTDIREQFSSMFGADSDAALASFVLDRKRSLTALEKAISSSQAAGIGNRYGVRVSNEVAQQLGDMGYNPEQFSRGFSQIADIASLFSERVGETTDLTAGGTGVEAVFGSKRSAQAQLAERIGQRGNVTALAGGALTTGQGALGLGSLT